MIATATRTEPPLGPVRLRIQRELFDRMKRDLTRPHPHAAERVGFLSVATGRGEAGEHVLLGCAYDGLDDTRYLEDEHVGARIDGRAIRDAMQRVLDTGHGIFHVHVHPHSGVPGFSGTDRREQPRLVESLANAGPNLAHGMLVLSEDAAHAWVRLPGELELVVPAEISIIGDPMAMFWPGEVRGHGDGRFSRQGFLGPDAEYILAKARIGVVGMGGGGSHTVQQLLHLGARRLRVFDHDRTEWSNLNRMVGATVWDAEEGTRKIGIARRIAAGLRADDELKVFPETWQDHADVLAGCDIVLGAVDTFAGRRDLEAFCRRFLIPYVDIGMDVHVVDGEPPRMAGQVIVSLPGNRCMHCLGFLTEERLAREAANYGAAGGRPQVVWPNGVLASTAVGIVVDLLTGWSGIRDREMFLSYDGNRGTIGPHPRWPYVGSGPCSHYSLSEVGEARFRAVLR
ncbi:MAG TPA: ThiF family adenylyltransferase [Longimicrobium sp.]|jgi:hypothetical protein|uniref:HesA/MoeB/ThiF family protein n=1 Tax=Longimicrobium sp. TaxID=2029185 RepID=UPI002ED9FE28